MKKIYIKPTIISIHAETKMLSGSNEQGWNNGDGNVNPINDGWTNDPD